MTVEVQTLKLDSAFKPIALISWQDAISLVLLGKAYVIEAYEQFIRSAKRAWQMPAVIVLKRFVDYEYVGFSCNRKNILLRDNFTCQYCRKFFYAEFLTIDHVIPKSRGGKKSWHNLVAACRACNQRKGNRLPDEVKMFPIKKPVIPGKLFFIKKFHRKISPEIKKYV